MSTGRATRPAHEAAQWSRARGRVARRHHPDMGGDVDTYLAALQRVDDEFHLAPAGTATIGVHRDPSVRARAARAARGVRSTVHRALSHLPRRWRPGPTYHDL